MILFSSSATTTAILVAFALFPVAISTPLPQPFGALVSHSKRSDIPSVYVEQGNGNGEQLVTLRVGLKAGDVSTMEQRLKEVTTPGSAFFRMYPSKDEVDELAKPSIETLSTISTWLSTHHITLPPSSHDLAYPTHHHSHPRASCRFMSSNTLSLTVPLSLANTLLSTTFAEYVHTPSGKTILRTKEYFLPEEVAIHVDYVHPTTIFDLSMDDESKTGARAYIIAKREEKAAGINTVLSGVTNTLTGLVGGVTGALSSIFHIPILHAPYPNPPTKLRGSSTNAGNGNSAQLAEEKCKNVTTPACLQAIYGIPDFGESSANGVSGRGMTVTGFINQYANEQDFANFTSKFRPDIPSSSAGNLTFKLQTLDGGINPQEPAKAGIEASLDIQYSLGMTGPRVPVTFLSVGSKNNDGDLSGFLDTVQFLMGMSDADIPRVVTTSYGANEGDLDPKLQQNLCNAFMQLTMRGVSILFSSGDGGVAGTVPGGSNCKTFLPTFPSGCPYITSVGSTHSLAPEIGSDFSSGGFSNVFSTPDWQQSAVKSYLNKVKKTSGYSDIKGKFNKTGRGFPDVSIRGVGYQVIVGGKGGSVEGTSASTPLFGAMVALVNAELESAGQAPLGFLNPLIYGSSAGGVFTDVTSGSNPGCGTQGFPALRGWDPITGLGTPAYSGLRTLAGL